jgi:hypothetical protein
VNIRALSLCIAVIPCLYGQSAKPTPAQQQAILARIQEAAINYSDRLQDFTCTQFTIRSTDHETNAKKWSLLETQELEVTYVSHREHYRLMKVNGKSDKLEKRIKGGYFRPGGEFGSTLQKIFEPKAEAEFAWDGTEENDGKRGCVFRYHVAEETTTLAMQVNEQVVPMGHHGVIHADCETGSVLRIQLETEPAWARLLGRRAVGSQIDIHYGLTTIASKEFLVPLEAVEIVRFGNTLTKAELQFSQYRKYDADSSIKFDPDPK